MEGQRPGPSTAVEAGAVAPPPPVDFAASSGPETGKPFDMDTLVDGISLYQVELDEDAELRDKIRTIARAMEKSARKINFLILDIHRDSSKKNMRVSAEKGILLFALEIHPKIEELEQAVPETEHYKYNDCYKFAFQRLAAAACTVHFLLNETLCTLTECADLLNVPASQGGKKGSSTSGKTVVLEFEEYLSGLLDMGNELSRLSRNCITFGGTVDTVMSIHACLNQLNTGLHSITFKNDSLRKKYDGLKYHLKSVEEVVYDLKMKRMDGGISTLLPVVADFESTTTIGEIDFDKMSLSSKPSTSSSSAGVAAPKEG